MPQKIFIDFTVFESPQKAHARICGNVEVQALPVVGEAVRITDKHGTEILSLAVQFVTGHGSSENQVFGLDDVVANSRSEAQALCGRLESQAGLEYEPHNEGGP